MQEGGGLEQEAKPRVNFSQRDLGPVPHDPRSPRPPALSCPAHENLLLEGYVLFLMMGPTKAYPTYRLHPTLALKATDSGP